MTQKSPPGTGDVSRRRILATSGSLVATALAGCNALGGSGSSAIKEISKKPWRLDVTLSSGDVATSVNFINPDGTPVTTKSVSNGQTQVKFPLIWNQQNDVLPLPAGEYTIVAEKDDETVGKQTIKLTRSYKLVGMRVVNDPVGTGFSPNEKDTFAADIAVQLKNTGDLPVKLAYLGATKGVPSPVAPPGQGGMRNTASHSRLNAGNIPINAHDFVGSGQRVPFRTKSLVLLHTKFGLNNKTPWKKLKTKSCTGEKQTATLLVKCAHDQSPQRYSVTIQSGGNATRMDSINTEWACSQASVTGFSRQ